MRDRVETVHDDSAVGVSDFRDSGDDAVVMERRRQGILTQLRKLPDEAFTRLQYLQPQVGCFNRCEFCSQHAGVDVWQFTRRGLTDFLVAFACAVKERGHLRGRVAGDRSHRPYVLFPYIDNDVGSYSHLDRYVDLVHQLLNCTVRLSTVGFSSHSAELTRVHRLLTAELREAISGFRLSVTPFTHGWADRTEHSGATSREQFVDDLVHVLRVYSPLIDTIGAGKDRCCAELRFRPLAVPTTVTESVLDGRHLVASGPHLLIEQGNSGVAPELSHVVGVEVPTSGASPVPVFSQSGTRYVLSTSRELEEIGARRFAQRTLAGDAKNALVREVEVYLVANCDGPYYAVDPTFDADGTFRALHVYPETMRRRSGYNDATRYFLNALLDHKRQRGLGRRSDVPAAIRDVASVVGALRSLSRRLRDCDPVAARHLRHEIIPLVDDYATALLGSGLSPSLFFSREFTIDTGQAVNHGRGRMLFRGLVTAEDEPVTPWEERSNFGSSSKGHVWRIAPVPFSGPQGGEPSRRHRGAKNLWAPEPAVVVQELDPCYFKGHDHTTGAKLREYRITGVGLERVRLDDAYHEHLLPGSV